MVDTLNLAKNLFGGSGSNNENSNTSRAQTSSVYRTYGTCTSNSANGQVEVEINGVTTTLPCTASIQASTTNPRSVIIEVQNNKGIVTGYAGWGDSVKNDADAAQDSANAAKEKANAAKNAADALEKELDDTNATVTDLSGEVGTMGTRIENAVTKADNAATKADESLKVASEAKQTATTISTTLSKEYSKTGKDTTYSTKSELTQTASDLTLKITDGDADARKVATNYLNFNSTDGLVVGDMTAKTLAGNTQITSEGMNIRNGTTNLAEFKADSVSLNSGKLEISSGGGTIISTNGTALGIKTQAANSKNYTNISSTYNFLRLTAYYGQGRDTPYYQALSVYPNGELAKEWQDENGIFRLGKIRSEVVLYSNTTGKASGSITFSKSIKDYTRLLIKAKKHDEDLYAFAYAQPPATSSASTVFSITLDKAFSGGNWLRMIATGTISGTKLTINVNKTYSSSSMGTPQATNELYITEVIGIA